MTGFWLFWACKAETAALKTEKREQAPALQMQFYTKLSISRNRGEVKQNVGNYLEVVQVKRERVGQRLLCNPRKDGSRSRTIVAGLRPCGLLVERLLPLGGQRQGLDVAACIVLDVRDEAARICNHVRHAGIPSAPGIESVVIQELFATGHRLADDFAGNVVLVDDCGNARSLLDGLHLEFIVIGIRLGAPVRIGDLRQATARI